MTTMMKMGRGLDSAWWALRIGLGLGLFLAGLAKFFNILTDWRVCLSPLAERMLPVSPVVFMRAVGVVEMIVGLAILTRWTRIGSYGYASRLTVPDGSRSRRRFR